MASVSRTIHRFGYKCALTLWVDKKWTVVNLDMPDYFSTCQKGPMMESRQDEIFFGDFAVSNKILNMKYMRISRGGGVRGPPWKFFWICACRNYPNKAYNKDGSS